MNNLLMLITGMMLVTYIPRLLPFIVVTGRRLPEGLRRFLLYIPYTALGALIFPGVFNSIPQMPIAAVLAMVFAGAYAWKKGGIIISVVGAIFVAFCSLYIGSYL
ncbi:AzlD domain-containing protein [Alkaliphilus serpentinus]|uniref:AzlD domain-containing protein n=1 Tax=Alkaliphilus serpentinus TaxID=1482731 RepID=A0A833HME9_9FIRM|nr:AzlD domain-containing protein [Alkaliphilus serpentinus]KAB3526330.1 AzlD domain-containing protein [Alkaliphilus serpentinus]